MATINTVTLNFNKEYAESIQTAFIATLYDDLEAILEDGFCELFIIFDEQVQGVFKYVGSAEILLKDLTTNKLFTDRYSICSINIRAIN